ncbi:uncharacterized protein CTRU02_200426 [Colletotrichum truncatum]|uniref:Uncharacterized protein n=1 Tax=Colletotrichum truncatum TaxID=5467 RepID=A0ACC3ZEU0_COLTU|nr:uncharacterized protein CTRU02_00187 [Colletotrichum truncatum]KAF6801438.1 hypothetical protein CTRU02_00187 [Colletotrichum truncatum]
MADIVPRRASLGGMPAEVLSLIISNLIQYAPPTHIVGILETLGLHKAVHELHDSPKQYRNWKESRSDLVAIHSTSKYMAEAAKPFLYRSIAVEKPHHLEGFYRVLNYSGGSGLGRLVQAIYLLGDLQLGPRLPHYRVQGPLCHTAPLRYLAGILSLTHNLHELLITSPNEKYVEILLQQMCSSQMPVRQPTDPVQEAYSHLASCSVTLKEVGQQETDGHTMQLFPSSSSSILPLSSVRKLRLRHSLHKSDSIIGPVLFHSYKYHYSCHMPTYLEQFPNLETLELLADAPWCWRPSGRTLTDTSPPSYSPMPKLKHLRLYLSSIQEPELVGVCLACPNLETLLVYFANATRPQDRQRLPQGKGLNDVLLDLSRSLRHLELLTAEAGNYLSSPEGDSNGQLRRLICLPRLTNLQCLVVDFTGLFGLVDFINGQDVDELPARCPPNLTQLTIACRWGRRSDCLWPIDGDDEMRVISALKTCYATRLKKLRVLNLDIPSIGRVIHTARQFIQEENVPREAARSLSYLVDNSVNVGLCDLWEQFEYQGDIRDQFPTDAQIQRKRRRLSEANFRRGLVDSGLQGPWYNT